MSSRLSSLVICAHSTVVRHTLTIAASVAAIHLPATNATRGAGFTSSGSSDPRSRSPAVESVAICMPPTKPATMMNIGMNVRICAARCCAVETSISSIASGRMAAGLTPRMMRRRLLISAAYCCKRSCTRCTDGRTSLRELSATSCSGAGRDDRNRSAKSSGTITTTASRCSRTAFSASAGPSTTCTPAC